MKLQTSRTQIVATPVNSLRHAAKFIGALVVASLLASCAGGSDSDSQTRTIHGSFAYPVAEDPILAGVSDLVAVVRISSDPVNVYEGDDPVPVSRFVATVRKSLKGDVESEVTLLQEGGVTEDNVTYVWEGDRLMQRGKTYLIAARATEDGSYLVIPRFGTLAANTQAEQDALARRFEKAVQNQARPTPPVS